MSREPKHFIVVIKINSILTKHRKMYKVGVNFILQFFLAAFDDADKNKILVCKLDNIYQRVKK